MPGFQDLDGGSIRRSRRSSVRNNAKQVASPAVSLGKKRKASPTVPDAVEANVNKKVSSDGREIDHYCWMCHTLGEDVACSSCPRVYHKQCLKRTECFNSDGLCPECQIISIDGTELTVPLSHDKLTRLLKHALDRMLTNESILKSWPITDDNDKLLCIMDLSKLADKLNDEIFQYTKTAEFYSDVKWIFHNCIIVYGANHPVTASAKRVLKKMKDELRNIEACPECYESANSNDEHFFIKVCNTKHVLVWAKLKGYPYWPAKCLKVLNGVADVRFFKTHDKGSIKVNKCYLLSKESPDASSKNNEYKEAMSELKSFLRNWELKFGAFQYAPVRVIYDPNKPEDANIDKSKKTSPSKRSPSKRSRRGRASSNRKEAENVSEDSTSQKETTAVELPVTEVPKIVEISQQLGETQQSVKINASGPEVDEIEIIREVTKSDSQTSVRKRSFMENLSLSNADLQEGQLDASKKARQSEDSELANAMETSELNPVSVCMTFSTDEDEPPSNDEQDQRNEPNALAAPPIITITSPLHRMDKLTSTSVQLMNTASELESAIPLHSISEVPGTKFEANTSESLNYRGIGYAVAKEIGPTSFLCTDLPEGCESSTLMPRPISVEDIHTESGSRFVSEVVQRLPPASAGSVSPAPSPIRIVGSGTVIVPETEIINVENSPQHEMNTGIEIDEVQICEESAATNNIPSVSFIRALNHSSTSTGRGNNNQEGELSRVCEEASSFMRTLISRVWSIGHNHKSSREIHHLIKGMDNNFKLKEAALTKLCDERERELADKTIEWQQIFSDLKKKINDTDLILMNTKLELQAAEASHRTKLEQAQKEWEERKLKEFNEMKKLSTSAKEIEDQVAKRVETKEKEFKEEINKRLEAQEKELQRRLAETKRKEWCANCLVEAKFRCCWNTNYCGKACQLADWPTHMQVCEMMKPSDLAAVEASGASSSKEKNVISLTLSSNLSSTPPCQASNRALPSFLCRVNSPSSNGSINGNSIQLVHRLPANAPIQIPRLPSRLVRAPVCFPAVPSSQVVFKSDKL